MNTTIEEAAKTKFKFSELSQSAKQRACQDYAETGMDHGWWEFVYEDYKEKCEAAGFRDPEFSFSGFWSQGDGAKFNCHFSFKDEELAPFLPEGVWPQLLALKAEARLLDEPVPTFYYAGVIEDRGYYSHCYEMTVVDSDGLVMDIGMADRSEFSDKVDSYLDSVSHITIEKNILEAARDIAQDLYKSLENEYVYQTSEESVEAMSEANDWLYDEDGRLIWN